MKNNTGIFPSYTMAFVIVRVHNHREIIESNPKIHNDKGRAEILTEPFTTIDDVVTINAAAYHYGKVVVHFYEEHIWIPLDNIFECFLHIFSSNHYPILRRPFDNHLPFHEYLKKIILIVFLNILLIIFIFLVLLFDKMILIIIISIIIFILILVVFH